MEDILRDKFHSKMYLCHCPDVHFVVMLTPRWKTSDCHSRSTTCSEVLPLLNDSGALSQSIGVCSVCSATQPLRCCSEAGTVYERDQLSPTHQQTILLVTLYTIESEGVAEETTAR